MNNVLIGKGVNKHVIGDGEPIFIIAEAGINHNGDIEIAKKLIDLAVSTGCHAIKFQKRTPELCVPEEQKSVMRETPWGTMTYLEYKKRLEFGYDQYCIIDRYCNDKNILWFASAWDIPSVEFLEKFDLPCYKIASASLTDKGLIIKVKSTGKPIILSTGMSTLGQIDTAAIDIGYEKLIILHCNSSYPAVENELNLNVIKTFKERYSCPIGYSGHESGMFSTIVAMALGACVIERHITIDRAMYGTDQAASLSRQGLEYICSVSKLIPDYLGDGIKCVYESEKKVMQKLRKK